MDKIKNLREIVSNPALSITERITAADHLVRLTIAEVPSPADDDAEVAKLIVPWPRTTETQAWIADFWADETGGRSLTGYTLPDAKAVIQKRHKRELLAGIAADVFEDQLMRDAAKRLLNVAA